MGLWIGVRRGALSALVAALAMVFVPAAAAQTSAGYDISYPQCATAYPANPAFGIVGVNGGLANDANSCFASELQWALGSPGLTSPFQPNASLYINTANPGPTHGVKDWPTSGTSPYGNCNGTWSQACSYVYGEQRAGYSYGLVNADNSSVSSADPWWLDIETANSWATRKTKGYTQLNIAAIHGFIAGLQNGGASGPIGIYSTASQWNTITGLNAQTSPSAFGASLPDWVGGGGGLSSAQTNCSTGGFTGAAPTLAQYSSGGYDADLRCS
jgi:hypothetical protein